MTPSCSSRIQAMSPPSSFRSANTADSVRIVISHFRILISRFERVGRQKFQPLFFPAYDDLDKMSTTLPSAASSMSLRPPPSQSPRLDPKLHIQRLYAGTPIPSVDSAVESWDSLANLETPASPTSPPPASPAPIPTAVQPPAGK